MKDLVCNICIDVGWIVRLYMLEYFTKVDDNSPLWVNRLVCPLNQVNSFDFTSYLVNSFDYSAALFSFLLLISECTCCVFTL